MTQAFDGAALYTISFTAQRRAVASHVFASLPATVLVFLPAAAGTRIIASDFRAGADRPRLLHRGGGFTDDIAGFLR